MSQLQAEARPARSWAWPALLEFRWSAFSAAAAVVVLAFIGGWWAGNDPAGPQVEVLDARDPVAVSAGNAQLTRVNQSPVPGAALRYVRVAFVSADPTTRQVNVAGSFNDWDPGSTPLHRRDGVWSAILVLEPGSYEYMFVEDGSRWTTDPLAVEKRDDGFGGMNAVLNVDL